MVPNGPKKEFQSHDWKGGNGRGHPGKRKVRQLLSITRVPSKNTKEVCLGKKSQVLEMIGARRTGGRGTQYRWRWRSHAGGPGPPGDDTSGKKWEQSGKDSAKHAVRKSIGAKKRGGPYPPRGLKGGGV